MALQQTKKLLQDNGYNGLWRQDMEWDKAFDNYNTGKRQISHIY